MVQEYSYSNQSARVVQAWAHCREGSSSKLAMAALTRRQGVLYFVRVMRIKSTGLVSFSRALCVQVLFA